MNIDKFAAKNHALKNMDNIIDSFDKTPNMFSKFKIFIFNKFGIWDVWDILPYKWNMWYYDKLKPIFKPCNKKIRNSIPKKWCDISGLIVNVNFEFIKQFYEDEYVDGFVDWTATENHKEFAEWLELSYKWITKRRPQLEKERDDAYPKRSGDFLDSFIEITDENGKKLYQFKDDGIPYEEKYAEVNRLEELIEERDTEILKQLIKRREYFWT